MTRSYGEPWEDAGEEWQGDTLNPFANERGEEWKQSELPKMFLLAIKAIPMLDVEDGDWMYFRTDGVVSHLRRDAAGKMQVLRVELGDDTVEQVYLAHQCGAFLDITPKAPEPAPNNPAHVHPYIEWNPNRSTVARTFPNISAWLEAERTGTLDPNPLREPHYYSVYNHAWWERTMTTEAITAAQNRLTGWGAKCRTWPRVCCKCGKAFRPTGAGRQKKAKHVRCAKCRKGRAR